MPLAEALEQVDLDVGRTYCCQVKGRWVQVRVLESEPPRLAKPYSASDMMLDPWVELPGAMPVHIRAIRRDVHLPFDVPSIPIE